MMLVPDEQGITYHEEWDTDYSQLQVGRSFVIASPANAHDALKSEHVIILDAVTNKPLKAFGTGMHPTTQLCLNLMEDYVKVGNRVLDVGTGSGVLAILAARLGAGEVQAFDIDPLAVAAAQNNVAANGLDAIVSVRQGSLADACNCHYDVVVANVIPGVLIAMIPEFLRAVHSYGFLLVSGIIAARTEDIVKRMCAAGFAVREQRTGRAGRAWCYNTQARTLASRRYMFR
jgi:ribosomal protein L11 methyltransferase